MRVKAIEKGYYKGLREPGVEFEYPLRPGEELPDWVEKVEVAADEPAQTQEPIGDDPVLD